MSNIAIYPNPSSGFFSIEIEDFSSATAIIYNIMGQKILNVALKDRVTSLSLTSGMYLLEIQTRHGISTKKLIVR